MMISIEKTAIYCAIYCEICSGRLRDRDAGAIFDCFSSNFPLFFDCFSSNFPLFSAVFHLIATHAAAADRLRARQK